MSQTTLHFGLRTGTSPEVIFSLFFFRIFRPKSLCQCLFLWEWKSKCRQFLGTSHCRTPLSRNPAFIFIFGKFQGLSNPSFIGWHHCWKNRSCYCSPILPESPLSQGFMLKIERNCFYFSRKVRFQVSESQEGAAAAVPKTLEITSVITSQDGL